MLKANWRCLKRLDIEDRQAVKTSIMPENLPELMTQQEFRDLLAYLQETQITLITKARKDEKHEKRNSFVFFVFSCCRDSYW